MGEQCMGLHGWTKPHRTTTGEILPHRTATEVSAKLGLVDGGGHKDELQIGSQGQQLLEQREKEVGVQGALVNLSQASCMGSHGLRHGVS